MSKGIFLIRSPEQIADSDRVKERAGGGSMDTVTEYEVNVGSRGEQERGETQK